MPPRKSKPKSQKPEARKPRPVRASTALARVSGKSLLEMRNPRKSLVMRRVFDQIGENLVDMLTFHAHADKRVVAMLAAVAPDPDDPTKVIATPAKAAANAGILPHEIARMYQEFNTAIGLAAASGHIPEILEDMAQDARSTEAICAMCRGHQVILDEDAIEREEWLRENGLLADSDASDAPDIGEEGFEGESDLPTMPCPQCGGAGVVRRIGSMENRKMLLTGVGVLKSAPQAAVQINQFGRGRGFGGGEADLSVEALNDEVEKLLGGGAGTRSAETLEAEVVEG